MKLTKAMVVLLLFCLFVGPGLAFSAVITSDDSTQPRGAPVKGEFTNPKKVGEKLHLGPIVQGFRAPAYRAKFFPDDHFDWKGMPMANIERDPGQFAMLGASNRDFFLYVNSVYGSTEEKWTPLYQLLKSLKLLPDVEGYYNNVKPKELIPVTGDLCNRCHSPVGWMEAHSEPPTNAFPFLKGQFWAAAFLEYPGHKAPFPYNPDDYWAGDPHTVKLSKESEAEMEGIQCDYCHRQYAGSKRKSLYNGNWIAKGNGSFFVNRYNVLRNNDSEIPNPKLVKIDKYAPALDHGGFEPYHEFLHSAELCGTCHDVTNPIVKNKTKVKVGQKHEVPDMPMPIERTYTEWYWSAYRSEGTVCQSCHEPMKFPGAQTWLLYPSIDKLWGELDKIWTKEPFSYPVSPARTDAYMARVEGNKEFMRGAASLDVSAKLQGKKIIVDVKVTNNAGHKLPTGYPEGRQMWIEIEARDINGEVFFKDGYLDDSGKLVRTSMTKVYEAIPIAEGYEENLYKGYSILDANKDGIVSHREKEFHFVLNNKIDKDNRIPPKGFNKAAYTADGAFIVPRDPQDCDYADGQNWDVTTYEMEPPLVQFGQVTITAKLKYQTFNQEFIEYLDSQDKEKMIKFGGNARNAPSGPYENEERWGRIMKKLWAEADYGKPVEMASKSITVGY